MDNTLFSNRVGLLATLHFFYKDNPDKLDEHWKKFIERSDLSLPLAFCIYSGYATATKDGENMINVTWEFACSLFGCDPFQEYQTIEEMQQKGAERVKAFDEEYGDDEVEEE